jgi:PAS domain S-box-containing protein
MVHALRISREKLQAQNLSLIQSQLELELSRDRYVDLYDAAPVCFVTLTRNGIIREVNASAMQLLNRKRDRLIGSLFVDRIAVTDRRLFLQYMARCRRNSDPTRPLAIELELARKPGEHPVFIRLISTPASAKLPMTGVVFQCVFLDVTEQKRADVILRESETRFSNLANNAPVLIWMTDVEKKFTWFNHRWLQFVGRAMEREIGEGWKESLHPADQDACRRRFNEAFDARRSFETEFRLRRADGAYRFMLAYGQPMFTQRNEFTGYIGSCIDITDRKLTEMELEHSLARERELRKTAETADRAKDDFLAALSHELRTPLHPILLVASDAAGDRDLPPGIRARFDTIRRNVELEARLIDDLLDLTRVTTGKLTLDRRNVNIHAILKNTIALMQADIDQKKIVLKENFDAFQTIISGDTVRLQQIFWNVLKNAVKFTSPGGIINIHTTSSGSVCSISVSDTGIGMTATELDRAFQAFAQGDHAKGVHRFGGLGLGLAITKKLMELHAGTIEARSGGRHCGSTFIMKFPLAPLSGQPVKGDTDFRRRETSAPNAGINILLVEDHEPTRTTLANILVRRHHNVKMALSVNEALALAANNDFDVVISDIGLPDGSGHDLFKKLKKRSAIKGIALTGYGMDEDVQRSQEAGFDAHLTKPVRIESLEGALARVMAPAS